MAQVLDSPHSSPLSSRSVLNIDLGTSDSQRIQIPSTHRVLGRAIAEAAELDPFAFHDGVDDKQDEQKKTYSEMEKRKEEAEHDEMNNLLVDNSSQFSLLSQKSQPSLQQDMAAESQEIMTQNADLTQMTQDANDASLSLSPVPPKSPISPLRIPWGRLMPCHGGSAIELLPKAPESEMPRPRGGPSYSILGLERLHASDVFNSYTLGRSIKVAVTLQKPTTNSQDKEQRLQDWAFALISNRHCRVYCTLPEDAKAACLPGSTNLPTATLQVWVEDSSNNGTLINGSVLLRKGQKRLLHSGDEISLVNPETLRKKIRDDAAVQKIQKQYSFVFVVSNQQPTAIVAKPKPVHTTSSIFSMPAVPGSNTSSAKRRRGLVNPRAMNYPPNSRTPKPVAHRSPPPAADLGYRFVQPTPRSAPNRSSCAAEPEPESLRRIEEEYDIRDLLGRGICEVRRAIHRVSGKEFAVKIISLPSPGLLTHKQQQETNQLKKEADIMQGMKHPYIVDLVDVFMSKTHLYLVMELCLGGDLFDSIVRKTKYSETESRRCMRRLLAAINYIHEDCHLVHRDLKPENILLTSINDPCDVKITDFGVAKSALSDLRTFCGTPSYLAPEIMKRRHTIMHRGSYAQSADMWSIGVIFYILLSGIPPYSIDGPAGMDVVLQKDMKISFPEKHWSSVSVEAKDLVSKLLNKDPGTRISVRDAMEHPWILMEDGDTHRHPLEDPKLIAVTKKRLFSPSMNGPTPVTTAATPPKKVQANKRRRVWMEKQLELQTKANSTCSSKINGGAKLSATPSAAALPPRPLSPVENRCGSPPSSPPSSPSVNAKKFVATTKAGENDENFNHLAVPIATETLPQQDDGPKAVTDTKAKRPTKNSPANGLVMAAELEEDKICSQFTDEEASVSSFSETSGAGKPASSSVVQKGSGETAAKTENNVTKSVKSKAKKGATKKSKSSKSIPAKSGGGTQKQATLAKWFQPIKKS